MNNKEVDLWVQYWNRIRFKSTELSVVANLILCLRCWITLGWQKIACRRRDRKQRRKCENVSSSHLEGLCWKRWSLGKIISECNKTGEFLESETDAQSPVLEVCGAEEQGVWGRRWWNRRQKCGEGQKHILSHQVKEVMSCHVLFCTCLSKFGSQGSAGAYPRGERRGTPWKVGSPSQG